MELPRVLHVDSGRSWRGGQRQVFLLATGLRDLGYRTDEEIADWRAKRDPIQLFRARLTGDFKFSAGEVDAIEQEAIAEVEDAVAFARDSAFPDAVEAWTDVFAPAA